MLDSVSISNYLIMNFFDIKVLHSVISSNGLHLKEYIDFNGIYSKSTSWSLMAIVLFSGKYHSGIVALVCFMYYILPYHNTITMLKWTIIM